MQKNQAAWALACLPLVKALAEGKTIELNYNYKNPDRPADWIIATGPDWSCGPDAYRVKPEPREVWVVFYSDSPTAQGVACNSKEALDRHIKLFSSPPTHVAYYKEQW